MRYCNDAIEYHTLLWTQRKVLKAGEHLGHPSQRDEDELSVIAKDSEELPVEAFWNEEKNESDKGRAAKEKGTAQENTGLSSAIKGIEIHDSHAHDQSQSKATGKATTRSVTTITSPELPPPPIPPSPTPQPRKSLRATTNAGKKAREGSVGARHKDRSRSPEGSYKTRSGRGSTKTSQKHSKPEGRSPPTSSPTTIMARIKYHYAPRTAPKHPPFPQPNFGAIDAGASIQTDQHPGHSGIRAASSPVAGAWLDQSTSSQIAQYVSGATLDSGSASQSGAAQAYPQGSPGRGRGHGRGHGGTASDPFSGTARYPGPFIETATYDPSTTVPSPFLQNYLPPLFQPENPFATQNESLRTHGNRPSNSEPRLSPLTIPSSPPWAQNDRSSVTHYNPSPMQIDNLNEGSERGGGEGEESDEIT
ncbi:MAG: hypothetical protein Q9160_006163 [Pyrenula sp. 1 TL-2023]